MSLLDECSGKWRDILLALGIPEKHLGVGRPCPLCGGDDRFSFTASAPNGVTNCRKCGGRSAYQLLKDFHGWDDKTTLRKIEGVLGNASASTQNRYDPKPALNHIYKTSKPVYQGCTVHKYLQARGISLLPESLRYHPSLTYRDGREALGRYPAMLAMVTSPQGEALTYHRTYLQGNRKANVPSPKKLMTPKGAITGGAIRLYPPEETLGIAEGIETALSACELFGVPTWAAVNAHGLEAIKLPQTVKNAIIFADVDASFTGQASAYALAKRLTNEGIKTTVKFPSIQGDWNDQLKTIKGIRS